CAEFRPRAAISEVRWKTVRDSDWESLVAEVIAGLPTSAVYLSIDKDCLLPEDAITNWEEGRLPLPQLLGALRAIAAAKDVVGVDITGEYSTIEIRNALFRALSAWDHPGQAPPAASDLRRNE